MFNNQVDNEADFCESYKSQILNNGIEEKPSLFKTILKMLFIILLLGIIIALSLYGYNYFINKSVSTSSVELPPVSMQVSDDDLVVTIDEEPKADESKDENQSDISIIKESDIDKIANDVKREISKSEMNNSAKNQIEENLSKEKNISEEESLKVPVPNSPEAKYLEDLADLSKEIDKERKKK